MNFRNKRVILQTSILLTIFLIGFIWFKPTVIQRYDVQENKLKEFRAQNNYERRCFENSKIIRTIEDLQKNLHTWSQGIERQCQILWSKFQRIFDVKIKYARVDIPSEKLRKKVYNWLGQNEKLMKSFHNQTVYHIRNLFTMEHTIFNSLRSKRPQGDKKVDPTLYVNRISDESKLDCDFCNYKSMTTEDQIDRIIGKSSVSASNAFKLDKWHALFISNKHNPLHLTLMDVLDLFNTSIKWFKSVHSIDKSARYPVLIWDNLPHAGASQLHPHIHGMFNSDEYYGALHIQYNSANKYYMYTGDYYWNDFIEIHHALGLTAYYRKAVAIAPLASKKDHEIFLINDLPNSDMFTLLYYVIQMYNIKLKKYCFSSGMGFPDILSKQNPTIIRIGTRGDCSSIASDVSSLELYSVNNVNSDPYRTIEYLREILSESQPLSHDPLVKWFD